jgi:hypothetical protein
MERMFSKNSDMMTSYEREFQDMLRVGRYLGSGPRYLLYYYGQLAITNDSGLKFWPEGPRKIVAVIKARECANGFSPARKAYLMAKLHSLEDVGKRKVQVRFPSFDDAQDGELVEP